MIEIELKAKLADNNSIQESLEASGFRKGDCIIETDMYFNASDRDFRKTDEALRLRSAHNITKNEYVCYVTYKGKKLDNISQTRPEYEVPVGNLEVMHSLLTALGYNALYTVKKERWYYSDGITTACLDKVDSLGSYIELERLAESEADREKAVTELMTLLDELGIDRSALTRSSYLELLIKSLMH